MKSVQSVDGCRSDILLAVYAGAVAFCILALFVERFAVNLPFWDEWVDLRFWAAHQAGTLTWADVFAQHNEHRITLPRMLFVALYELVGEWNMVTHMVVSALCMGATVAVFVYTLRRLDVAAPLALAMCLLLTSPVQWDNILFGYQLQIFASVLGLTVALSAVALDDRLRWRTVAIAIAGCLVSAFSFGGGLCSWPAAGMALLVRVQLLAGGPLAPLRRGALVARLALFAAAALAGVGAYFIDYHFPPSPLQARDWAGWLDFATRLLSQPLLDDTTPAPLIALAAALWAGTLAAMIGYARRRQSAPARDRLVLFAGWVTFLVVNAAVISSGRATTPYVPSRYATMSLFASALWLIAAADLARWSRALPAVAARAVQLGLVGVVTALLLVHADRYLAGLATMREQRVNRAVAHEALAFYLREQGPRRRFAGFAPFPRYIARRGDFGQPELVAALPADLRPAVSGPGVRASGDAWLDGGGFEGAAGVPPPQHWGTWRRAGAAGTGELRVGPLPVREPIWRVPIAGSVGAGALAIVAVDDPNARVAYDGPPPGDAWGEWVADLSPLLGRQVELVAIDALAEHPGWLAVGRPRPLSRNLWRFEQALANAGLALQLLALGGAAALMILPRSPRRAWRLGGH